MHAKLRTFLVDDHPVIRVGVRLLLGDSEQFTVCGEAGDVASAQRLVEELLPDLIVLDLLMGGRDGPELVEDLLTIHPGARILIFSSMDEMTYAKRVLQAGAKGYVMKAQGLEMVAAALEKISRGDFAFSEAVQQLLFASAANGKAGDPMNSLSNRELQIFRMLGSGQSTADIAAELHLSVKTIGTYRERLKDKLNLHSARELEKSAQDYIRKGTAPLIETS